MNHSDSNSKLEKTKKGESAKAASKLEIQKKATKQAQNNISIKNKVIDDLADEQS